MGANYCFSNSYRLKQSFQNYSLQAMFEETGPPPYRQNTPAESCQGNWGRNKTERLLTPALGYFQLFCGLHLTLNILLSSTSSRLL